MRKRLAGILLAVPLIMGVGPMVGTAFANTGGGGGGGGGGGTTDPVLCFIATESIIREALVEYRAHQLSAAQLRSVLRGASVFLGDCLTP